MTRDPGDIIDRFTIALLKYQNIGKPENVAELSMFLNGLNELFLTYPKISWLTYATDLYAQNSRIWSLESELRQGKLDNNLLECGKRAIAIRDANRHRVELKNEINQKTQQGAQDVKQDHLSR